MSNRWFRFVIAILAIGAGGAAGYRIFQHEQQLASVQASSRAGAHASESALATILEIKAALHAYVAPGQGHAFWMTRVDTLLDQLRAAILELDSVAATAELTTSEALDLSDRLAAAEQRARNHVRAGQSLLAGELIFTDVRDLLDSMRLQVTRVREEITQTTARRDAEIRREQVILALGAAGVLALAVLVLVPPGRAVASALARPSAQSFGETSSSSARPSAGGSLGETSPAFALPSAGASFGETSPASARSSGPSVVKPAPDSAQLSAEATAVAPSAPPIRLSEAAAVCTDLGRVSQSNEISALLTRAATVLSASGVIVWISSENRDELFAAAASGYDDRLFAQIGSISRDESNLTAAAFRAAAPRTTTATASFAAALAVPLMTPHGPIGVFSAELHDLPHVDADRLALSTIFAAQLANLLGAVSTPEEIASPAQQAQA